jgi:D-amino-acid dehydrogenase
MKILVLGGGVIGVTTAYYLNREGFDVTLVDRQTDVAQETSFANGGQVSWGAASPWAEPGLPWKALAWLLHPRSALVLRFSLDPALWSWMFRLLKECHTERYAKNKERQLRLSRFSHECLVALKREENLSFDSAARGTLVVFRREKDMARAYRDSRLLSRINIPFQFFNRSACVAHEPALRESQEKIAGAQYFPGDESGDCETFSRALFERARRHGVQFLASTNVETLLTEGNRVAQVKTDRGVLTADAVVLACGSYSPLLLKPLGIHLPVVPVKGYSITLPIARDDRAPQGTVTDETYKTVVTRLGNRLRAAGTAELAGYDLRLRAGRLNLLKYVVNDLFPNAGDTGQAQGWAGLRPMTPDNPPVLGVTPYKNLYLNTGHGTLGWTMACGSARVLTELLSGRDPGVNMEGLTLDRFL